jgi:LmbE family N-acetylglucosaminyl deacetylase
LALLPAGPPAPLAERVAVLSPHLDDAVLSLGAVLSAHVRRGGHARVVTVFAGRPGSSAPAGEWDRSAGFTVEGPAVRVRRAEDLAALGVLGVAHRHLDVPDEQYPGRSGDDVLWELVQPTLEGAQEVLLPGFPLRNADHAAVTGLVLRRAVPSQVVRLYLEEPYALRERAPAVDPWAGQVRWAGLASARSDAVAKARAVRCYASQLPLLAPGRLRPPSRAGGLAVQAQLWRAARTRGEGVSQQLTAGRLAGLGPAAG